MAKKLFRALGILFFLFGILLFLNTYTSLIGFSFLENVDKAIGSLMIVALIFIGLAFVILGDKSEDKNGKES